MVQTCHTGGTGGGVDYPHPGLLCCPEGVGEKSTHGGLYARTVEVKARRVGGSTYQVPIEISGFRATNLSLDGLYNTQDNVLVELCQLS